MPAETFRIDGERVNRERIRNGWNRVGFYRAVGMDARTGRRVLSGGPVSMGVIRRVALTLDLKVQDLVNIPGPSLAKEPQCARCSDED